MTELFKGTVSNEVKQCLLDKQIIMFIMISLGLIIKIDVKNPRPMSIALGFYGSVASLFLREMFFYSMLVCVWVHARSNSFLYIYVQIMILHLCVHICLG